MLLKMAMARTANVFARVEPVAYRTLTKEQFDAEIEKGMEDIKAGRVYSADEVEAEMKREFGIQSDVYSRGLRFFQVDKPDKSDILNV